MQNNIIDCHCHSDNSFDADYSVQSMADSASNLGVHALCITDHCDFFVPNFNMNETLAKKEGYKTLDLTKSIPRSVDSVRRIASDYPNMHLLAGVELGQAVQDETSAKNMLTLCEFDFVLGSLHNLARTEDFYYIKYTKSNAKDLLRRYFNELLQTAEQNLFDSLAHITYPVRYITGGGGIEIDLTPYYPTIDKILQTVIKNGKGIELNTSGLYQSIGTTMPSKNLLSRYRSLGGEIITVGSDSHCPKDISRGILQGYAMLKQCGFDRVAYYRNREPQFVSI